MPPRTTQLLLLLLLLIPPPAQAANPNALWQIVHDRCVPDQQFNNDPAPCAAVILTPTEADGHALLKDIRGATQYLLIPTARITGIESPALLAPGAAHYFAAAWAARPLIEAILHRPLPREALALAINSPQARSQEQLHIHIDCLRPDIAAALHDAAPSIGLAWAPLPTPLAGHTYRARFLPEPDLATTSPFQLLATDVGPAAMPQQTLVLAGATAPNGQPGFILLADHTDLAAAHRASGEELQDHDCTIAHPAAPPAPPG